MKPCPARRQAGTPFITFRYWLFQLLGDSDTSRLTSPTNKHQYCYQKQSSDEQFT